MRHIKTTLFVLFTVFTFSMNLYAAGNGAGKGNGGGQKQGVHAHEQSQGQGEMTRKREHAEGGNCTSSDNSACTQNRDRIRDQTQIKSQNKTVEAE